MVTMESYELYINRNSPSSSTLPVCTFHEKQTCRVTCLLDYYTPLPSIFLTNSISLSQKRPSQVLEIAQFVV